MQCACRKCGYELHGLPFISDSRGLVICPECGDRQRVARRVRSSLQGVVADVFSGAAACCAPCIFMFVASLFHSAAMSGRNEIQDVLWILSWVLGATCVPAFFWFVLRHWPIVWPLRLFIAVWFGWIVATLLLVFTHVIGLFIREAFYRLFP